MDEIRKQLDELMGANRNGDVTQVTEVARKYYDRDVCRLFLAGLCPYEVFLFTKADFGPCTKVHSFQLRKEYQEAKSKGQCNYDAYLEDELQKLIVIYDKRVERALQRLSEEDAKVAMAISVSEVTQSPEILELSKRIKEKLDEADQYDLEGKTDMKIRALEVVEELRTQRADIQGLLLLYAFNEDRASSTSHLSKPPSFSPLDVSNFDVVIDEMLEKAEALSKQGMVDESRKALKEALELKKLSMKIPSPQEPVADPYKNKAANVLLVDQKLRVCDVCGSLICLYNNEHRLADHLGGKLHLGYMQIREKLADILEERNNKKKAVEDDRRSKERSRIIKREGSSDGERTRDSDRRSRDRDRHHDHGRVYDWYDRDSRSRRMSRSWSNDRVRDNDRPRSKERSRILEREGSRDREPRSQDRDHGYDRYDCNRETDHDSRSRQRSHSRSRDHVRDYDGPRSKERSKDLEREGSSRDKDRASNRDRGGSSDSTNDRDRSSQERGHGYDCYERDIERYQDAIMQLYNTCLPITVCKTV